MESVTVKAFDTLTKRDFDNGAVRDAIRQTLGELEKTKQELADAKEQLKGMDAYNKEVALALKQTISEKDELLSLVDSLVPLWIRFREKDVRFDNPKIEMESFVEFVEQAIKEVE